MARSNKSNSSSNGSGTNRANGKSGNRGPASKSAGKNSKGGNSNGKGASSGGRGPTSNDDRQSSRRRKSSRKKRVDPAVFWGDVDKLPKEPGGSAQITPNPSAVIQSLGRAPLAGQQNAADLYFAAVYDRSVNLAAALAAAGGLIEPDDLA